MYTNSVFPVMKASQPPKRARHYLRTDHHAVHNLPQNQTPYYIQTRCSALPFDGAMRRESEQSIVASCIHMSLANVHI